MRPLARKALEAIREQGGRVIDHVLIERTLKEIGKEYRPGLIRWLKKQPDQWERLLTLEGEINKMALCGDLDGLREALSNYQGLIVAMVKEFNAQEEKKG
jgi:hypothetical protein